MVVEKHYITIWGFSNFEALLFFPCFGSKKLSQYLGHLESITGPHLGSKSWSARRPKQLLTQNFCFRNVFLNVLLLKEQFLRVCCTFIVVLVFVLWVWWRND